MAGGGASEERDVAAEDGLCRPARISHDWLFRCDLAQVLGGLTSGKLGVGNCVAASPWPHTSSAHRFARRPAGLQSTVIALRGKAALGAHRAKRPRRFDPALPATARLCP